MNDVVLQDNERILTMNFCCFNKIPLCDGRTDGIMRQHYA